MAFQCFFLNAAFCGENGDRKLFGFQKIVQKPGIPLAQARAFLHAARVRACFGQFSATSDKETPKWESCFVNSSISHWVASRVSYCSLPIFRIRKSRRRYAFLLFWRIQGAMKTVTFSPSCDNQTAGFALPWLRTLKKDRGFWNSCQLLHEMRSWRC